MLSFSNAKCDGEVKALGFPQDYFDLPDAIYETGQVSLTVARAPSVGVMSEPIAPSQLLADIIRLPLCTPQVQFAGSGDRNELVKMFDVKSCDTFVYLPAGSKITDFEKKIPDGSADLHE